MNVQTPGMVGVDFRTTKKYEIVLERVFRYIQALH